MKTTASDRCFHCGDICDPEHTYKKVIDGEERSFCCHGCLSACLIIFEAGEGSYYNKRSAPASKLFEESSDDAGNITGDFIAPRSRSEINKTYDIPAVVEEYVTPVGNSKLQINFSIEGIHCSSCVFLNEKILQKTKGITEAQVNYENGRAHVVYDPEIIQISSIIETVQSIGYNAVPMRPGQKSDSMMKEGKDLLWRMVVAGFFAGNVMLIAAALFFNVFDNTMDVVIKRFFVWLEFILATPAFFYSGAIFHRGWKSFLKTGMAGMDFLISSGISIAYFYSVYVVFSHEGEVYFDSVTTITFFLLVGRYFEWMAKYRQRIRMEDLVKPLPAHCSRVTDNGEEQIAARELKIGDKVRAVPGDMLPADGTLLEESCEVDESVLTGESLPVMRQKGDRLLAGSKIVSGIANYRVESMPHESSLSILSRLADSTGLSRSRIEKITLKIIPLFSSAIMVFAGLTFTYWMWVLDAGVGPSMTAAIAVLIVSCPCALALSVPTAIGSAIYLGLTHGILVRDGSVLESFAKIKNYFFDKTGTLTKGRPELIGYEIAGNTGEVIPVVEFMESGSAHPVGRSLLEFARDFRKSNREIKFRPAGFARNDLREVPGRGMEVLGKKVWRLGNREFLKEAGCDLIGFDHFRQKHKDATVVGIADGNRLAGIFALKDTSDENTRETLSILQKRGVNTLMLTGDNEHAALSIASEMNIPEENVHANLLPADKEKIVVQAITHAGDAVMVGDGYNDAIALSRATVSVVLARGAPLSLEHAGIILLQNNLSGILSAEELSRKARRTIYLNLTISLIYNSVMIPIAASGMLLPIWCSLFMSLSSLTVVGISIFLRIRGLKSRVTMIS